MKQEQKKVNSLLKINLIVIFSFLLLGFVKPDNMYDQMIQVHFEDLNQNIDVKIITSQESAKNLLKERNATLDSISSKKYKINIYKLNDAKIIAEVKKTNRYAYEINSLDEFHLIRTRAFIYKLDKNGIPFYSTIYRGKSNVEAIVGKYEGKELKEYSNEYVKLYLLNNGKYFHTEHIYAEGILDETRGVLYNSKEDCKRLYLFDNIKENLLND